MTEAPPYDPPANGEVDVEWRPDTKGREFVPAKGRSGVVYRQGEETPDQAWERDQEAQERKKRTPKAKTRRKPPAPTQVTLKELEHALNEALSAPAMIAAMNGDEWGAQHFSTQAPAVSRNLVKCAEHNPWVREKLIALMAGEGALMNVMVFASLGAACFAYVVPPVVYYLNPRVIPESARIMVRARYAIPDPPVLVDLGDDLAADQTSSFAATAAETAEPAQAL